MAGDERTAPDPLTPLQLLESEPYAIDFFQAMRRLECANRQKPPLGRGRRPGDETMRLGQDPSLSFPASTLSSFTPAKGARKPRLGVTFFGAFGPNGPLPLHLTEFARQRIHNFSDPTFARFIDVFHHRLLCAFYRAWADARPAVSHDRPEHDRFVTYLGSVLGIGTPALRRRDSVPDGTKLYFAGRFGALPRNAEGLRAVIGDFFQMPVKIEEFVGEWVTVAEPDCWRLAMKKRRRAPQMGVLGRTTLVGRRVWERQHKFRVVLGPLRRDQFDRMLPSGPSLTRLATLIRNYVGDQFRWDARLILRQEAVSPLKLGHTGQLGRTSFIVRSLTPTVWDDVLVDPVQHLKPGPSDKSARGKRAPQTSATL